LKNELKLNANQTKIGEKPSKKKLTFFAGKMSNENFLQLFEISMIRKSQEGLE